MRVFGLPDLTPQPRRYHKSSDRCGDSSDDVVANALDAINPGDYAGLIVVQGLTSLQRPGPEGFAARNEKVAQSHRCQCEEYRHVISLYSSNHFRTLVWGRKKL